MNEPKFNPNSTIITRVNKQMSNPMMTWAMVAAIVSATITGTMRFASLEASTEQNDAASLARHLTAMEAIDHEKDMRILTGNNVNDNVDEVKKDVKELKDQMKEDNRETQRLLRELIQKQNSTTP